MIVRVDLAGMVAADAVAAGSQLADFVSASVTHAQGATPTLTVGDITQLAASVANQGTRTVSFKTEATLPAGLTQERPQSLEMQEQYPVISENPLARGD